MSQPVRAHPPPTHHQSALIRTVSPSSSAHALRAKPRPSTHPGDPSPPRQRCHRQWRLLSAGHNPADDGGDITLTALPADQRLAAPSAPATRPVSRTAVRQSRHPIRRSRLWCDRSRCKTLRAHRARRPQHRAIEDGRSCPSPSREAARSLSFARNRHGSYKLPCRFEAGRNIRPLAVQQGRAARTPAQANSVTRQ